MNDAKTVANRLRSCSGPDAIAKEALTILLEATGASAGHLFCLANGRLRLVASSETAQDINELTSALDAFLQKELASDIVTTALETATLPPSALRRAPGAKPAEPLVLLGKHEGDAVIAGIAALHYSGEGRPVLRRSMLEALTNALITSKLAQPVACVT